MPRYRDALALIAPTLAAQDGVISRSQALQAGASRSNLAELVADKVLHRVRDGLYVVGLPSLNDRQLSRCGVVVGGAGGGLTARASLETRKILDPRTAVVTVASLRPRIPRAIWTEIPVGTRGRGLIRVVPAVKPPPLENVDGLLCTPVPRALVDLAASPDGPWLKRAWDACEFRGALDETAIARELDSCRRKGGAAVRALLDDRLILTGNDVGMRSRKELDVLHLIASAGLPMPEENAELILRGNRYFADFYWRLLGLVLELDSPDHLRPEAGRRDRSRDQDFFVSGIDVVRYLDTDAIARPEQFVTWLGEAIARQQRRIGAPT